MKHCVICSDIKHFNSKVYESERIARNIENILSKYGNIRSLAMYEQNGMRHQFSFDHQHQHFMCGHCVKANLQSLKNAEKNIVDNLLRFVNLFKVDKLSVSDSDYHMILRSLQGHYPGMYRALEREWCCERDER